MSRERLTAAFREAFANEPLEEAPLGASLEGLLLRARGAWPDLEVDAHAFAAHLARRCPVGWPPEEYLQRVFVEDLYLAFACAQGHPAAQRELDAGWLHRVEAELGRKPAFAAVADDAVQTLRQKLFLAGPNAVARIATYSGTGPLLAMLRAAAIRTALNLTRAGAGAPTRTVEVDESLALLTADPEADFLKVNYRPQFAAAFRQALAELPDDRVNVLRLHLVDGLNIEKIGLVYQAHRSTVARWIADSRLELLRRTRAHLAAALKLDGPELDSLIRLVRSTLDVSLRSALVRR